MIYTAALILVPFLLLYCGVNGIRQTIQFRLATWWVRGPLLGLSILCLVLVPVNLWMIGGKIA